MSLTYAAFAIAGLIAAMGPVLIHLWNRRRYRTLPWGAMEFLARALGQSRKRLQLRDFLVLLLRTLAILFFGLALARPIVAANRQSVLTSVLLLASVAILAAGIAVSLTIRSRQGHILAAGLLGGGLAGFMALWQSPLLEGSSAGNVAGGRHPVHAILVIDNSQSMASRSGEGTLLDVARGRASEAISDLPPGSRVSVLPLCDGSDIHQERVYRRVEDAETAITRVQQTDEAGSVARMLSLAAAAAKQVPELSAKRALFLTDLQATGWPRELAAGQVPKVPLRIVAIGDSAEQRSPSNLYIESFMARDGLVEPDSPAAFLATVRHAGARPIENVEIALWFDGTLAVSEVADFEPGQSRSWQWSIPIHTTVQAGQTLMKPARLTLRASDDRGNQLARDDTAHLAVPLVRGLPVLFVDQYGTDESLEAGRVGETYRLRRLLAPRPREGVYNPLVEIRQATIEEMTQEMLADTRLVVIAGVESPTPESIPLLRDYMEQGGPVLIAAGAGFDPASWNDLGWRDGLGILPARLAPTLVGVRPSQATASDEIIPRQLDVSTLRDSLFQIAGVPDEALADLWSQPFFFQVANASIDEAVRETAFETERQRIGERRELIEDELPGWLVWQSDARAAGGANPDASSAGTIDELARARLPRVLARFGRVGDEKRGLPYLIERQLGYGRVLFLTSGISSDWDTLTQTNAIVLLDRLARSLIQGTLPDRTVRAGSQAALPIQSSASRYILESPSRPARNISPPSGAGESRILIEDTSIAGIYTLKAEGIEHTEPTVLAVNGPASESHLARLNPDDLNAWREQFSWELTHADEKIILGSSTGRDDWPWRWLAGSVIGCLLLEMLILGRSSPRREERG